MCVRKSVCVHTVELDRYDRLTSTCYWEESVQPSVTCHNTSCLEPPEQPCDQDTGQPEIIETGKRAMMGHTEGVGGGGWAATCDSGWWGRWWRDEGRTVRGRRKREKLRAERRAVGITMCEPVGQSRSTERKIKETEGKKGGRRSPCILSPLNSEESSPIMCKGGEGREDRGDPTVASRALHLSVAPSNPQENKPRNRRRRTTSRRFAFVFPKPSLSLSA